MDQNIVQVQSETEKWMDHLNQLKQRSQQMQLQ